MLRKYQVQLEYGNAILTFGALPKAGNHVGLTAKVELPKGSLIKANLYGMAYYTFHKADVKAVVLKKEAEGGNALGMVVLHKATEQGQKTCVIFLHLEIAYKLV